MIGRRPPNGRSAGSSSATVDAAISELEAEIARVEGGASLAASLAQVRAACDRAEQHFLTYGFQDVGRTPSEVGAYRQVAFWGALLTLSRDHFFEIECDRVRRVFAATGMLDMSDVEKAERLVALRAELRPLLARRELAWRRQEGDRECIAHPDHGGEFFLASDSDLQRIADGREAAL